MRGTRLALGDYVVCRVSVPLPYADGAKSFRPVPIEDDMTAKRQLRAAKEMCAKVYLASVMPMMTDMRMFAVAKRLAGPRFTRQI